MIKYSFTEYRDADDNSGATCFPGPQEALSAIAGAKEAGYLGAYTVRQYRNDGWFVFRQKNLESKKIWLRIEHHSESSYNDVSFTEADLRNIAAYCEAAAEQYLSNAHICGDNERLSEQFRRQASAAKAMAQRIQEEIG